VKQVEEEHQGELTNPEIYLQRGHLKLGSGGGDCKHLMNAHNFRCIFFALFCFSLLCPHLMVGDKAVLQSVTFTR